MKLAQLAIACASPFALLCGGAQAAYSNFCNQYAAGPHPTYFQCAQAAVNGDELHVLAPDVAGDRNVAASRFGLQKATGGTASASASASPGLLRGTAGAQVIGGLYGDFQHAASAAWSVDSGTVLGAPGVSIGTPVSLRFTNKLDGIFLWGHGLIDKAEARLTLVADAPGRGQFINTYTFINRSNPSGIFSVDIPGFRVGDSFNMQMKLDISTGANNADPGNEKTFIDVSNTGHVYVDVLSAKASIVGASGHLYATAAPVPEPSTVALFTAGIAGLIWTARKRGSPNA
jgi:hypothetical protein